MKKLDDIMARLTTGDKKRITEYNHPHRQFRKYYRNRVGLTRALSHEEVRWLNRNTTGCYSVDFTIAPHNLSFENGPDAVLFKLTYGGDLACKPHVKY